MRFSTMQAKPIILIITLLLSCVVLADDYKVDNTHESVIDLITDKGIEEAIVKNLDLLRDFEIVENLDDYESLVEMIEDDEDN